MMSSLPTTLTPSDSSSTMIILVTLTSESEGACAPVHAPASETQGWLMLDYPASVVSSSAPGRTAPEHPLVDIQFPANSGALPANSGDVIPANPGTALFLANSGAHMLPQVPALSAGGVLAPSTIPAGLGSSPALGASGFTVGYRAVPAYGDPTYSAPSAVLLRTVPQWRLHTVCLHTVPHTVLLALDTVTLVIVILLVSL
jgi:hypothetical protein